MHSDIVPTDLSDPPAKLPTEHFFDTTSHEWTTKTKFEDLVTCPRCTPAFSKAFEGITGLRIHWSQNHKDEPIPDMQQSNPNWKFRRNFIFL